MATRRHASGTSARSCVLAFFKGTLEGHLQQTFVAKPVYSSSPTKGFEHLRRSAHQTRPPKQYSAPIDRVRRKRQRLPSSLLIENIPAPAAALRPDIFLPGHFR